VSYADLNKDFYGCRGTRLMDVQVALWEAMAAQGCDKVVDVCETHNIPALKLHIRMGYQEQGRVTHVYGLFGRWRFYRESRYQGSRLDPLRKPGRPVVSGRRRRDSVVRHGGRLPPSRAGSLLQWIA
jgi:hypothetical protein